MVFLLLSRAKARLGLCRVSTYRSVQICGATSVGLGHLIQQGAASAQRGAWRGSGFEAITQGWASVRAAKGLLISTTARAGSYGSAQSTQMDASEALAMLKGGADLGQRLSDVAQQGTAQALGSFEAGKSVERLLGQFDPKKDGKHAGSVNGQEAKKAGGGGNGRTLTDAVEAFATPLIVLDTPSTAVWVTEAGIAAFSSQDSSLSAQGDVHQTAAHTWASVSGKTSSWYVHQGGIKAFAANGAAPEWFTQRFPAGYQATQLFDDALPKTFGLQPLPAGDPRVLVSVPERAMLELLSDVGKVQSLTQTRELVESLPGFRENVLDPSMPPLLSRMAGTLARHCASRESG